MDINEDIVNQLNANGDNFWIAIAVGVIAFMQWRTSEKQRKQDLFEKRFKFYKHLKDSFLKRGRSLIKDGTNEDIPVFSESDLFYIYKEGEWLFSKDLMFIIDNLREYYIDWFDIDSGCLPMEIETAFDKYMTIEPNYNILELIILLFNKAFAFFFCTKNLRKGWNILKSKFSKRKLKNK